jgi:hypothetical protein
MNYMNYVEVYRVEAVPIQNDMFWFRGTLTEELPTLEPTEFMPTLEPTELIMPTLEPTELIINSIQSSNNYVYVVWIVVALSGFLACVLIASYNPQFMRFLCRKHTYKRRYSITDTEVSLDFANIYPDDDLDV